MSIFFSPSQQTFYDDEFEYPQMPEDLIGVSVEKHWQLYDYINEGRYIFADLTPSEKRPSSFHVMKGREWVDERSAAEKRNWYLSTLRPLTRRQFKLTLLNHKLLDKVDVAINAIADADLKQRVKIEFEDSTTFERLDPTLAQLYKAMGLTDTQVDRLWEEGLNL